MNRLLVFSLSILAAVVFWCSAAFSQNYPVSFPADEWTLERVSEHHYRVGFYNADNMSGAYPHFLHMGEMQVGLNIRMTRGAEVLTVTPPNGWMALPPQIMVDDGSIGWVEIIRTGEWLGM